MKTLTTQTAPEIIERINKLSPETKPLWGKMDATKMFAHCSVGFEVPLSIRSTPRVLIGYFLGGILKKKSLHTDAPFAKNSPTGKQFIIEDGRNFEKEKAYLIKLVNDFCATSDAKINKLNHAFFGRLTASEWQVLMYKHLDHHLRQFGV